MEKSMQDVLDINLRRNKKKDNILDVSAYVLDLFCERKILEILENT